MDERNLNNNEVTNGVSNEENSNGVKIPDEASSKPSKGFVIGVLGSIATVVIGAVALKHLKKNKENAQEEEDYEESESSDEVSEDTVVETEEDDWLDETENSSEK